MSFPLGSSNDHIPNKTSIKDIGPLRACETEPYLVKVVVAVNSLARVLSKVLTGTLPF